MGFFFRHTDIQITRKLILSNWCFLRCTNYSKIKKIYDIKLFCTDQSKINLTIYSLTNLINNRHTLIFGEVLLNFLIVPN